MTLLVTLPLPAQSKTEPLPEGMVLKAPAIPEQITGTFRSLNAALSKDLAPADNAVVFIVQAFGDETFEPELRELSLQMLGIQSLSQTAPKFAFLEAYVRTRGEAAPQNTRFAALTLQSSLIEAAERIWTRDDFVDVSDYLKANGGALDALVALTHKPRFFAPYLSAETPPSLLSCSKVIERRLPFIARTLAARGLNRIGDGDFASGMSDLIAGHKLVVLLSTGSPMDTSFAQANLGDSFIGRAEMSLIRSGKLTGAQAKSYLAALSQIPILLDAARAADIGERAILNQEIELLQANEAETASFFELPESDTEKKDEKQGEEKVEKQAEQKDEKSDKNDPEPKTKLEIKWDLTLKRANDIQSRNVQALSTRDRAAQNKQFDQLDEDYLKWMNTSDETTRKFANATKLDVDAASEWIGESMAMSLRPLYRQRRATEDRACQRRDFTMIGMALTAFRHDHGEYPQMLSELVPSYLKTLTVEADAVDNFTYTRVAKDHIRLMSRGVNRQDDAGKAFNDDEVLELK